MSADNLPDLPSYQPRKYAPDGGFEVSGILVFVIGTALISILMGGLGYWVSQYFYAVIIFPCLFGMLIGAVGSKIISTARIRNMYLVIAISLISGVLCMATMHAFGYWEYRKHFSGLSAEAADFGALPQAEQDKVIAQAPSSQQQEMREFAEAYQAGQSFPAYMDYKAKLGVSISSHSSRGTNLGYWGSIIYWLVEIGFVATLIIALVHAAVSKPYCTRCHVWKNEDGGFSWVAQLATAKQAVEMGILPDLVKSICVEGRTPTAGSKGLVLNYYYCGKCHTMSSTEIFLSSIETDRHGKQRNRVRSKMTYPGTAQTDLKKVRDYLTNENPGKA